MQYKSLIGLLLALALLAWIGTREHNPYPAQKILPPEKEEPLPGNTLKIPRLNLVVPVTSPASSKEKDIQEALKSGVAHYPGTARAGQTGNMYLVGHSSDYPWARGDYKRVFANLPKLTPGDKIEITDEAGELFAYTVIETKVVSPRDLSVLNQPGDKKLLTLQTSYPLGTALKRFVVVSELVESGQSAVGDFLEE